MFDMAVAWHPHAVSEYLIGAKPPNRETGRLNGGSFYDYYETKDGRYLSVGSLEPKFWTGFCHAIERDDLIESGYSLDLAVQRSLKLEIREVMLSRTFADWCRHFAEWDVCVEPVLTIPEMLEHPQTQAREILVDVPKSGGGSQRQVGTPFKFSGSQAEYRETGAALGAHTTELLAEAGYSDAEIGILRETGVFG